MTPAWRAMALSTVLAGPSGAFMPNIEHTNRLIHEKSPYLLQHAHNPVDWYPWGEEAFAKARQENKPILVSIGYSTCHWCHVMEHESYEDPAVAELMNRDLVNIKVDREERPDVDKIYMTAVSAMTGSGGWPLNVFLTPDLKPFYGGTYFPPTARWGQPAWTDVVKQIADAWAQPDQRKKIEETGEHVTAALRQHAQAAHDNVEGKPEWLDAAFQSLKDTFDGDRGGFGSAPKFPMPVYYNLLLRYHARTQNKPALDMTLASLRAMAAGGIYDQLGGGFARYSTDADWHVPHFEKMLYDNAQLAVNYLEAYQITRDPQFARVARETLDYVLRDMTHADGGFYSAEDADSLSTGTSKEKTEGAFYVWTREEIFKELGKEDGELFCFRFGVREGGNAKTDPHGEFRNQNILYLAHSIPETARHFSKGVQETEQLLERTKKKLFNVRAHRPRPHLDDKVLAAWNGLMISAFARGAQILDEPRYLLAAQQAASFAHTHLYDSGTQTLFRRWRDGQRLVDGTADDYAFLTQGLLDLFEMDFDPKWLDWSQSLTDRLLQGYTDTANGGFFMTSSHGGNDLLMRVKEDVDNVEPSASSVAALNLLRLYALTLNDAYQKAAEKTLKAFGGQLANSPRAMPQMLVALDWALSEPKQIIIVGRAGAPDTLELMKVARNHFLRNATLLLLSGGALQEKLSKTLTFTAGMKPLDGKATAYVCEHHTCQQPTNDPGTFEKLLARK